MFKIALWNVGEYGVTRDFITQVDILFEAEVIALEACCAITDDLDLQLFHYEDLEYGVFRGTALIGSFSILSL